MRALYPVSRVNWCKWGIRQPLGECSASHHSLNIIPLSLHFPRASHGKWTVKDKSEASMSGKQLFWSELKLLSCDGKIRNRDILPSSGIISTAAQCSVWFLRQEDIFLKGPPPVLSDRDIARCLGLSQCRDHGRWLHKLQRGITMMGTFSPEHTDSFHFLQ